MPAELGRVASCASSSAQRASEARVVALTEPVYGSWPFLWLPPVVSLGERRFTRSVGRAIPGVIAHYREAVPRQSHHLYVLETWEYVIDHADDYNPHAHPVRHFLSDVLPGTKART